MASKLALEIDFERPRLIFDDLADMLDERMKTESAALKAQKRLSNLEPILNGGF